jgi:hypothetical protein
MGGKPLKHVKYVVERVYVRLRVDKELQLGWVRDG